MTTEPTQLQRPSILAMAGKVAQNLADTYSGPRKWENIFMGLTFASFYVAINLRSVLVAVLFLLAVSGISCMTSAACAIKRCRAEGEDTRGPMMVLVTSMMFLGVTIIYGAMSAYMAQDLIHVSN